MSFTYEPASTNATVLSISVARRQLGDYQLGRGVLPAGRNLDDAEIETALAVGGGGLGRLAQQVSALWLNAVGAGEVDTDLGMKMVDRWSKFSVQVGGGVTGRSGSFYPVSRATEDLAQ